ncbi:hypothetical protein G6F46_005266 [Rhizopus delemar]|uniref:ADP-ribosylglycohydrolase n=2 Tax=Rhizopus TaxID=4842 RepID=A0A9P6ZAJ7_9FUNG|nr:hypothetical protein G6F43_002178 [Rhizopus delemar]KAG1545567.1 hypothetical protein G6F51_005394 [Rhizopus arrhizus]KAG1443019.1 hypothetical protein G6F55_012796 [Rhizopus delemar]KAG1487145.1 hypothetical protein G6F54_012841 [Rhizopus delemar]KAG1507969.1 hypothetical protein G6F53_008544 [Rhizopus delemar]
MHIPSGCSKIENSIIIDKIKGLIFGAILGDSIGIATEGLTKDEIKKIYGKGPIRFGMDEDGIPFIRDDYRSHFDENDFGQDSEQILLVVQSILENNGYFHQKDLKNRLTKQVNHTISLHSLLILPPPQNDPPSPALVRAPLLGAVKFWDGTSVIENAIHSCQLTRSDPRCMISCLVVSILVARLLRGQETEIKAQPSSIPTPLHSPLLTDYFIDSLTTDQALQILVQDVIETNKHIFQSSFLDPLLTDPSQIYHQLISCAEPNSIASLQLDKSTNVLHTLAAALYSFTRSIPPQRERDYFKKIMMDVIMQGGKAAGTTTGAILGARLGYGHLPTEWVVGMKRWEWLEDKIDEFCALF